MILESLKQEPKGYPVHEACGGLLAPAELAGLAPEQGKACCSTCTRKTGRLVQVGAGVYDLVSRISAPAAAIAAATTETMFYRHLSRGLRLALAYHASLTYRTGIKARERKECAFAVAPRGTKTLIDRGLLTGRRPDGQIYLTAAGLTVAANGLLTVDRVDPYTDSP